MPRPLLDRPQITDPLAWRAVLDLIAAGASPLGGLGVSYRELTAWLDLHGVTCRRLRARLARIVPAVISAWRVELSGAAPRDRD